MLSTALHHGFVEDPELPQRDLLLDPDAVRDRLTDLLGLDGPLDIEECSLIRSKYRIGESLRVGYRLRVGDVDHVVTARAFCGGASRRAYERARESAVELPDVHAVVHDAELDTVWWTFPNDRRLIGVDALLQPSDDLAGLVGPNVTWCRSDVMEYAPERSVTLRALDADGSALAYAKSYAPGTWDVGDLARRYDAVAAALARSGSGVSSPTPIGWSLDLRVLVLQAMPGRHWSQLPPQDVPDALRRLGGAIATLHSSRLDAKGDGGIGGALPHFGRLDAARLQHSAELVVQARPDVAEMAWRLAASLAAGPPGSDPEVVLHGDCHPKNALLDAGGVALIDLDQAGMGPASADVGSLLARLRHEAVLTGDDRAHRERANAFLVGYSAVRDLPSERSLRWHTAAALVAERAMRAVNRVHLDALDRLDELLHAASETLRVGVFR